jgi:acyl-CoA thioester hydrolase
MFERKLMAGWRDIDTNSHMGNTAYLDKAVDVRMMYFVDCGFPMSEFVRLRLGPVVMRDEVEYYREVHLLDEITVSFGLAGLSPDGSRMMLRNDIFRDGKLAARVTTTAAGSTWRIASSCAHPQKFCRLCGTSDAAKTTKTCPTSRARSPRANSL